MNSKTQNPIPTDVPANLSGHAPKKEVLATFNIITVLRQHEIIKNVRKHRNFAQSCYTEVRISTSSNLVWDEYVIFC